MTVGGAAPVQQLPASSVAKEGKLCRGRCKWFDIAKGYGFVVPDDKGSDIFIHHSTIYMDGFRSLDDDEIVEFVFKISAKGRKAVSVTGTNGYKCRGRKRRTRGRRKGDGRCYNCDEHGHYAKNCLKLEYVSHQHRRPRKDNGKVKQALQKTSRRQKPSFDGRSTVLRMRIVSRETCQ